MPLPPLKLRHSVRAIILDEKARVLLCRCVLPGEVVRVTPGGGVEEGESMHAALKREPHEEVGRGTAGDPQQSREEAGQSPFAAGSKIATHSTWWVIGNRSNARSVRTR
ncbi:NUDIX domain-containing protein [Streptomyces sp. KLOTTS4A1]|uniref:NUDIX domain-containing protein n=1 Tax=Streptomyces sp. KLOTTS4A1 TaxID=3390996 RepID=UPI0039F50B5E